ncbi:MAG: pyridoxal phosphate-dependent aminotransferase [Stygiobacter sp.]|nr:MAG: pyridoxal phosphate-dependent aminotransferase [Stygiobacter sp.]
MISEKDPLEYFAIKPVKAATVSEISEATASSPVPPEERVNFHIGNPVQDVQLSSAYLRMVLGVDITREELTDADLDAIISELGLDEGAKVELEFFRDLIKKSAPYTPRGGFNKNAPNFLIKHFNEWLTKNQQEPLAYDLGEKSGRREVIIATGGINEALRLLFHALSNFLINKPAKIFLYGISLPAHLTNFKSLSFHHLPEAEEKLIKSLKEELVSSPNTPAFLVLGKNTKEEVRRKLRQLSMERPLFFVEANDAPNHLSLAREAKMMNRVLRILTPGIFSPALKNLSTLFFAGNPDFIEIIETIHFQLKGTPSASEIELLSFILKNDLIKKFETPGNPNVIVETEYDGYISKGINETAYGAHAKVYEEKIGAIISDKSQRFGEIAESLQEKANLLISKSSKQTNSYKSDLFGGLTVSEVLAKLTSNIYSKDFHQDLVDSFLYSFLHHHPEYRSKNCYVISGSSRTGLGLLGFHCGITEVIFPDLSWTYEHCFPKVTVVPLTDNFELDVDGIIAAVKKKLSDDPHWRNYGAVALNNPHNATGQEFDKAELKRLLKWLLGNKIFVLDDLSYQNVAPKDSLDVIKTIRQLTDELVEEGYLIEEEANYAITVHSVSKTDSLAGARLSVIEIRHAEIAEKYEAILSTIELNLGAIFLTYLFYRNKVETVNAYWRLRNKIFKERNSALAEAVEILPDIRNRFDIYIKPPKGSMYPQMIINRLPAGLSLDWLASGLARQGIGLVPLSTFARTEKGFETGRKTFRLTLGGTDNAEILRSKTRRVLIDLNRMIAEEAAHYNRKKFRVQPLTVKKSQSKIDYTSNWERIEANVKANFGLVVSRYANQFNGETSNTNRIEKDYLAERLELFKQRFFERTKIISDLTDVIAADKGKHLVQVLEREFYRDDLVRREASFKNRLYDRTVHPTQMYSLKAEWAFEKLIEALIRGKEISQSHFDLLREELVKEYLGLNVAIVSNEESEELILDLNSIITAENYSALYSDRPFETFLSFWGDWDGSNRPSGQGHRLVAAVLIENVVRQARIIQLLHKHDKSLKIDPAIISEIEKLPKNNNRFTELFNEINSLTHQLEKRYRGILPVNIKAGRFRQFGMKLHIAQDPLTRMWHHNDRLERKMLDLRKQRRDTLEYYFSLNKQIRKTLHGLIPAIQKNISNHELMIEAGTYRDLLKRFIITPRIHQKLITTQDPFAIDTTVHNINEINEISGKYGNPGMVMALQVSMSTKPDALISLDRKLRASREEILREKPDANIPNVWSVPLFEDLDSVKKIGGFLNKIWEYSLQSRRLNQETSERFTEIITEVFVAGSDLSQQIGQAAGMSFYKEAKHEVTTWLAEHGLIGKIRMKMGSGEPMQRQGGYYTTIAGTRAFIQSSDSAKRFSEYLQESTKKSTEYATTPLIGVFAGGDLRTFQSNISEKLRYLPVQDYAQLLYHVKESQKFYETEIHRAGEPIVETRLQFRNRGLKELERLTIGKKDKVFDEFLPILTENFRQILYGREEDVVGIHIISYFIGRTTPPLRDRPTVRPGQGVGGSAGQKILEKIAGTIPFSKYGSLLRAISHNQSQTVVLGINQLTTGLFRALDSFSQKQFTEGVSTSLIADRILPNLPVYEILHTLRIYHDVDLVYLNILEKAFPAGNSALLALREDIDAIAKYLPLFQRELLRRHGIDVNDFFEKDKFIADLLPTLRADVAVLLQPDLFNTSLDNLLSQINGSVDKSWREEMMKLLEMPVKIKKWRAGIWNLLEQPVFQRVASFVELAIALHSLSANSSSKENIFTSKKVKAPQMPNLSQTSVDENMHQFLAAAMEYLSVVSQEMVEVPINIIRALKEAERIIKIEVQALTSKQQDMLRFYLLQIARLTGENG